MLKTCPPFTGFTQLAHPSRCSRSTLTTVCVCARDSVFTSGLQPRHRIHQRLRQPSSCCGVWDPWSVEYQSCKICNVVVVLKQRPGFVPTSAQFLRRRHFLDDEDSILNSFLYLEVPCVNVHRSLSCSQSIRQRIRRRTVTLYFNLHWKSQILVQRSQG